MNEENKVKYYNKSQKKICPLELKSCIPVAKPGLPCKKICKTTYPRPLWRRRLGVGLCTFLQARGITPHVSVCGQTSVVVEQCTRNARSFVTGNLKGEGRKAFL